MDIIMVIFTGIIAASALIGLWGVLSAVKTFKFNTWLKAQSIYMDPEFYNARETVLNKFGFDKNNPPNINSNEKDHAILVCRKMDELARLKPYVGEENIIEAWGVPMGKSWMILTIFVNEVREQDKNNKKWDAFQQLANEAIGRYNLDDLNDKIYNDKQKAIPKT